MLALIRRRVASPKSVLRTTASGPGLFAPAPLVGYIPLASGAAPFVTMVPKRKKADMALLQEDLPSRRQLEGVQYADYAPAPNPRRSGRVRNSQATSALGDYPDAGKAESKTPSPSPPRRSARTAKDKGRGREVVEDAMHELQDMEEQLRGAVKRQKLAVKSSSVMTDVNERDPEDAAFLPRPIRNELGVVPPRVKGKPVVEKKGPNSHGELSTFPNPGSALMVEGNAEDPEAAPGSEDINELKLEGARPPPVNSEYLPLPWKGRLGYACLNTYLRSSNPPVFSSRTCRISSILEHRHPLKDVSQPEHATKNRPDKDQPAELALGHKFVQELGLANARDIVKMIRWNDKYGIKFMRLSSEMFPFASHDEYGYKLAPFASEVLAEAGKLAGELGHRLTTHPGQFTQLGSPRAEVVKNAVRDLEYHDEMLSLLRLPEQANRDAVMILHMGGVFGDKAATLDRFRANYAKLSPGIKARLVLENDDVSWTVHDLLPICEELNIPMVLDFHHHNIMFDKDQLREGTQDIMELFPRIKATWDRKGITQKMHYSEPCPEAITGRQRRKHRPRVLTLPPCADTMDLMIEAKDKEQAVFELMRTYRLPGWNLFNDIVPYERDDENRPAPKPKTPKKKPKSKKAAEAEANDDEVEAAEGEPPQPTIVPDEAVGMGGPLNRVYWPMGMEEWLRPKKREVKRKKDKEEEQDES